MLLCNKTGNVINSFTSLVFFYIPCKHQKTYFLGRRCRKKPMAWNRWNTFKNLHIKSWNNKITTVSAIFSYYSTTIHKMLIYFMPRVSFYSTWKYQKTSGFLMFFGGIQRKHWHGIGKKYQIDLHINFRAFSKPVWKKWAKAFSLSKIYW